MDELDIVRTLAERGVPRGAPAIWRAATAEVHTSVAVLEPGDHVRGSSPVDPTDVVLVTEQPARPKGHRLVLTAAATVLAVVAGLVATHARSGQTTDTHSPDVASSTTSAESAVVDGPLARLVAPLLPAGFQVVSTGRVESMMPLVMALDRSGRMITIGLQRYDDERARYETRGTTPNTVRTTVLEGDASNARVATATSDVVSASCVLGGDACSSATVDPPVDVRPLVSAIAVAVSAGDRDALTSSSSLMDSANRADVDIVLDRIATTLGPDYELTTLGGTIVQRSWRSGTDPTRSIAVQALPSPVTMSATIDGAGLATAIVTDGGWIFTAVARATNGGPPPLSAAALNRQLRSSISLAAPSSDDAAGAGKLVLDPLPAGWHVEAAYDRRTAQTDAISRVYASSSATPERDPTVTLMASTGEMGLDPQGVGVESVRVQGTAGQLAPDGSRSLRLTFGPVAGQWVYLEVTGLDRAQLRTMAETIVAAPDGNGLSIPPTALPGGLAERAMGTPSDPWLQPVRAQDAPMPAAHWTDGRSLFWYASFRLDASLLTIYRLGHETVAEASVNGHAAFVTSRGSFRTAGWAEGDRVYLVGSNTADGTGPGISAEQLLDMASKLRPATAREWSDMVGAMASNAAIPATTIARKSGG